MDFDVFFWLFGTVGRFGAIWKHGQFKAEHIDETRMRHVLSFGHEEWRLNQEDKSQGHEDYGV